ncbi:uncharacterized protein VTP21DRAFT_4647 [Calcarisporiella thermophila]|uniref:uncharacterized protein n=1 Tax=Calcarisporiella thermophila TaxID=911321 RepID=UPI003743C61B
MADSKPETKVPASAHAEQVEEDEEDEYNERIKRTGCAKENEDLQLCFYDTRDWRKCQKEMDAFKECWNKHASKK